MDHEHRPNATELSRETGRVEAFSDGVFAIALTLLILYIKVPRAFSIAVPHELTAALLKEWPSFFGYILSFVFILIGWINHHRLFTHILRVNGTFLLLNGFLLLTFTFQPFPTSLLAEYIGHPGERVAGIIYASVSLLIAIGYQLLWRYAAYNHRLLKRNVNKDMIKQISREFNRSFPIFVLAFILSFISVPASLGLLSLLMLFFAVTGFTAAETGVE